MTTLKAADKPDFTVPQCPVAFLQDARQSYNRLTAKLYAQTDSVKAAETLFSLAVLFEDHEQFSQATDLYNAAHEIDPENPSILNNLAGVFFACQQYHQAESCFLAALDYSDGDAQIRLNYAELLLATGQHEHFLQACDIAAKEKSVRAEALYKKAKFYFDNKDFKAAIKVLDKAVLANKEFLPAHYLLADCYVETGRFIKASAILKNNLKHDPDNATIRLQIGRLLTQEGKDSKAAEQYKAVLDKEPGNLEAHRMYCVLARDMGWYDDVVKSCWYLLENDKPDDDAVHTVLGFALYAFYQQGDKRKAMEWAEKWQTTYPQNATARYIGSAITRKNMPVKGCVEYTTRMFDRFAVDFDAKLKQLNYSVPFSLGLWLRSVYGKKPANLTILDIGCGTGLCAPYLRPYALKNKGLVGVDLSIAMLKYARKRELYDNLVIGDAVEYMNKVNMAFELVICADVVIYLGELEPLFAAIDKVTKTGSRVFLSTESTTADKMVYTPSGRFTHNDDYVKAVAQSCSFAVKNHSTTTIRNELGKAVMGGLFDFVKQ